MVKHKQTHENECIRAQGDTTEIIGGGEGDKVICGGIIEAWYLLHRGLKHWAVYVEVRLPQEQQQAHLHGTTAHSAADVTLHTPTHQHAGGEERAHARDETGARTSART